MKKRKDNKDELIRVDVLDVLLDENNKSNIFIMDDDGNPLEMEQIAVVPYGEEELYAILAPVTKIEGIGENDAIVFRVDSNKDGNAIIVAEQDQEKATKVFQEYYKLVMKELPKANDILFERASELVMENKYEEAKEMLEMLAKEGIKEAEAQLEAVEKLIKESK